MASRRSRASQSLRPKGLAKAVRGATVVVRGREMLSREAEEWMFRAPDVLTEGSVRPTREGGVSWFGSTMITFDLEAMGKLWRGPFDEDARQRLADLVEGSVRVRLRAMRLACAEVARRLPDRPLGTAQVETRVRIVGHKLYVDLDLEVPIDVSSAPAR